MTTVCDDEMDEMLVAFKRQAKKTLRAIQKKTQLNGFPLSPQFKEYFLSTSKAQ